MRVGAPRCGSLIAIHGRDRTAPSDAAVRARTCRKPFVTLSSFRFPRLALAVLGDVCQAIHLRRGLADSR